MTSFVDSLVAFRDESSVEFDASVELSDPYDVHTVTPVLYGFAEAFDGDSW